MDLENRKVGPGAELDDGELEGVSGGAQNPTPLQAPTQPQPSRPSIPADPGLPSATPKPTSLNESDSTIVTKRFY